MTPIILVGADSGEAGERAAKYACRQAAASGARIVLANGIEWSRYEFITPSDAAERHMTKEEEIERANIVLLEPLKAVLEDHGIPIETVVRHGHPAEVPAELATELGASQIIVGRHGHSKLGALLFGSVANAIGQLSPVPVVIVP